MQQLNSWTFFEGEWLKGNPKFIGPLSHGSWMGSPVFDGARIFDGCAPDLISHCERVIKSAEAMLMKSPTSAQEIYELTKIGAKKFGSEDLYVRPLIWAEDSMGLLRCDPDSTKFCLSVIEMPLPDDAGLTACFSSFKKPDAKSAPTNAKAACLYPNGARAMQEAISRGFQHAIMLDQNLKIAEFASANLFIVKNEIIFTPKATGCFLAGITRARVMDLAKENDLEVIEADIEVDDVLNADEVFSTGNYSKLSYFNKIENKEIQKGAIYEKLRGKYFEYAMDCKL